MSRDHADIPEVFRRAMEEAGWDVGDDSGNRKRPPMPRQGGRPWWTNRFVWIIALFVLIFMSFNWIVTTYTEWLWFSSLNYQSVWLKQWVIRVLTFVVSFIVAAAVLLGNWVVARRRALFHASPFQQQILRFPGFNWLIAGVALFLAFGFASAGANQWDALLRYVYRVGFGTTDPIFNRDISFYLFELPVYQFLQGWVLSLLVMTLLGVIALYAINNLPDIQRGRWHPQHLPILRQHAALVGAVLLGVWTLGYWLGIYGLLYSTRGVAFGASYTDMHAIILALRIQLALMALTALALAYNIFRLDLRPVLVLGGLWLAATLLLGGLFPALQQRYVVQPNEIELERPYIEHNIAFTRLAFGLDNITRRPFETITSLTAQDVQENEPALRNVRLWDYRPLQAAYQQLQALRTYYQFGDVDIDRYIIDGDLRQVMLATRELNKANLPAPSWVNLNLEFTHGYGIVMNPVDEFTVDGQPVFFIQDVPPRSSVPIEVTRPELYYGEFTTDSVFVASDREEFSYPSGTENVYSTYEGEGGVLLDTFLKRLAFALRLTDVNVMLSDEITPATRIKFHRQIQARVRQITPFLALDNDPYMVVWNGRLIWIQDAYTFSRDFPYSEPMPTGLNYIRNAAKITIDAYDGTVTYYIAAPEDPIIQAYVRAFPDLFRPLAEMPEGLLAHIRYPEGLFTIQADKYRVYHMTDVRVFYNKEDVWQIPMEIVQNAQQPMEPYYVILALASDAEPEFLLIQPFTPAARNNMVAWMAARNDMPHYGELIVYELPKQELVFGPIQIESRIDQEPGISQQFALWDQSGSQVIRGNLLVIPLNNSFLYVEPIYLQAATSALPELKRVIVASDTRIVMRPTLDEALTALLQDAAPVDVLVIEGALPVGGVSEVPPPVTAPPAEPAAAPDIDAPVEELIQAANRHFEAAERAQRNGDWATYGRELEALRLTLQRLAQLSGGTP